MLKQVVICDQCRADLGEDFAVAGYKFFKTTISVPTEVGGARVSHYHFCGWACLGLYAEAKCASA